ncbi:hypothetical protein BDW02DRAFT_616085 [Decorospora gaudefroyi]|uniref:C2H2-type domain-containing protein n=1 Tax=Decorospora gaudefroyi TaxID=184978 RepID=A0A6A5K1P6_9PLEO|nr:hypothetical protein BDW02DRAFT_616085 [Decorospora gaudefroyi]
MSLCVLCNRTFGGEKALKQHEENSPKHAETLGCKPCNRSFGSLDALGQHQHNSPAHRKPRKDSVASSFTPVPPVNHAASPLPTTSHVRHLVRNSERNRHATTKNTSQTDSTFDLPFEVLENRLRALAIPDLDTIVAPPTIDRAHIPTRQEETRTFFTFPELHQRIAEAVAPTITSTWFNPDIEAHFDTEHETNVMGKFTCENKRCRKSQWSSKVVAVWIKGYPRNGYNAIVYNQRCKSCDRLGSFKLDAESYVERIAYRLKRWAGVRVEQPPFSGQSRGPHESEHCEGCKAGHCSRADDS